MSAPETARDIIGRAIHEHDANACMGGVEWPTWDELDDENRAAYRPVGDAILDALTEAGFAVVKLPEPDMTGEHVWNETEGHPVANYFADGCDEWVMSCCGQVDVNGLPPDFSPTYARNLAARLLAAAAWAEAGERDE